MFSGKFDGFPVAEVEDSARLDVLQQVIDELELLAAASSSERITKLLASFRVVCPGREAFALCKSSALACGSFEKTLFHCCCASLKKPSLSLDFSSVHKASIVE